MRLGQNARVLLALQRRQNILEMSGPQRTNNSSEDDELGDIEETIENKSSMELSHTALEEQERWLMRGVFFRREREILEEKTLRTESQLKMQSVGNQSFDPVEAS